MKTFLEIGTCDFDTLNHLSNDGWRGVIVEPIKKYLNNIPQLPNIHYLNYAVDWESGTRAMYLAPDDIVEQDHDFAGMSSFYNTNSILKNEVVVNTITIHQIYTLCNITEIDLLKIDTEGHDYEILRMVLNYTIRPKYIQAEIKHLNSTTGIVDLLDLHGYHSTISGDNIFAVLK